MIGGFVDWMMTAFCGLFWVEPREWRVKALTLGLLLMSGIVETVIIYEEGWTISSYAWVMFFTGFILRIAMLDYELNGSRVLLLLLPIAFGVVSKDCPEPTLAFAAITGTMTAIIGYFLWQEKIAVAEITVSFALWFFVVGCVT